MLRSILRIATAQREAFTAALIAEADELGPRLVEAGLQFVRFSKADEARMERVQAAYKRYADEFIRRSTKLVEDDG